MTTLGEAWAKVDELGLPRYAVKFNVGSGTGPNAVSIRSDLGQQGPNPVANTYTWSGWMPIAEFMAMHGNALGEQGDLGSTGGGGGLGPLLPLALLGGAAYFLLRKR